MYRLISNISRVFRHQFQGHTWKCGTKDDVGGLVLCTQPQNNTILEYRARQDAETGRTWYELRDEYWLFLQRFSGLHALGWSAADILGIHLKPIVARLLYHDHHNRPIVCPSMLLALGASSPPQSTAADATADPSPSELEEVLASIAKLRDEYDAHIHNVAAANCFHSGDYAGAVRHWQDASLLGDPAAQYNLALCYQRGLGVSKCPRQAIKLYALAVSNDHPRAMYNLACLYLDGWGGTTREAVALMERAADRGVINAQMYLVEYYGHPQHRDMPRAVERLTQAADLDHPDALYMLGVCCERGLGTLQNECRAADLYNRASVAGHAEATYNLAVMHELGMGGLPENWDVAKALYSEALSRGCLAAREALNRIDEDVRHPQQHGMRPAHHATTDDTSADDISEHDTSTQNLKIQNINTRKDTQNTGIRINKTQNIDTHTTDTRDANAHCTNTYNTHTHDTKTYNTNTYNTHNASTHTTNPHSTNRHANVHSPSPSFSTLFKKVRNLANWSKIVVDCTSLKERVKFFIGHPDDDDADLKFTFNQFSTSRPLTEAVSAGSLTERIAVQSRF